MPENDFSIKKISVFSDPELSLKLDMTTGEEILGVLEKDEDKIDVHILISPKGRLVKPVCLYLYWKKDEEGAKCTATDAKALLLYFRFLHQNNLNYWNFPHSKNKKQTFKFARFLANAINSNEIANSTARTYLRAIVKFYVFLWRNNLIEFSEKNKPFDFEFILINQSGMYAHTQKILTVQTTNLMKILPKEQKKHVTRTLSPLIPEHLDLFLAKLAFLPEDKALIFEVALATGMRLKEILTLPEAVTFNPENSYPILISIGPKNGVETKFSKERNIELPAALMQKLHLYRWSNNRQIRIAKGKNDTSRLFISNHGGIYSSNTIQKTFSDIRKDLSKTQSKFRYAIHDLRSTYATYTLDRLWKEKGNLRSAASILQDLMGHDNYNSTSKYVDFMEINTLMFEHAQEMSNIFQLYGDFDA